MATKIHYRWAGGSLPYCWKGRSLSSIAHTKLPKHLSLNQREVTCSRCLSKIENNHKHYLTS